MPSIEPSMASQQSTFRAMPTPAPKSKSQAKTSSSTPTPAAESVSKSRSRTRLSPDDHLTLMNQVCEHMGEYSHGKIKFWSMISEVFEDVSGLSIIF
jgi:hypothetical protein